MANGKIHSPVAFVKRSSSSDSDDNDALQETPRTKLANSIIKREEVRQQQLSELALQREECKMKMENLEVRKKQMELLLFDDDAAFFHSLLLQASQLEPKSKMEFRIKVQQLLYDFSFKKIEDPLLDNKRVSDF